MNEKKKIKVMVVDDHPMVRHGIKTVFGAYDGIVLVAEAENGSQAIKMCEIYKPDIILMDMVMPILDGAQATEQITSKWPDIKIIALTSFNDKELIKKSIKAGAVSYILKSISGAKLVKTIKDVYKGRFILTPQATKILLSELREKSDTNIKLTGREEEILTLIVEGLSNKQIAQMLFKNGVIGHLTGSYDAGGSYGLETLEVVWLRGAFRAARCLRASGILSALLARGRNLFLPGRDDELCETFGSRIAKWVEQNISAVEPAEIDAPGEDALKAQLIIEAAIQSWETGQVVSLD